MSGLMIYLTCQLTYIAGTMLTARFLHVRHSLAWMRWKNEAPDKQAKLYREGSYGGGGYDYPLRKQVELPDFIKNSEKLIGKELLPRGFAFVWPFFLPGWLIKTVCFPEVKLPDQAKIKELENL
jgi:hypothetical protein